MECSYFDAAVCRSCSWLPTTYADQLASKAAAAAALIDSPQWLAPVPSAESGFRNKAKMVVTGTVTNPRLGILGPGGLGVDLRECQLHLPEIVAALPVLADFIGTATLTPYDVATRRGELKHLLVTASPDGELMVRFVLRSREAETRIRKHLPALRTALPELRVVSINLLPDHKAVLEGDQEILLTDDELLPIRLRDVTLHLRPQSFFQTNTEVAARLYAAAHDWGQELEWSAGLDLFCGVGGFARHLLAPGRSMLGVELSEPAVSAATRSAQLASAVGARFVAGEAGDPDSLDEGAAAEFRQAELVVVNPPRRGIGALTSVLERSAAQYVLYSSCNAESLAADLAAMPSLRPVQGAVFDMFPHTPHYETLLLLARR